MENLFSLKVPGAGNTSIGITPPPGIPSGPQYTIGHIASIFFQVGMVIGIMLTLFYMLYGGFYWLQASGDKQKWDKARRIIVYSTIGLILMSFSLIIVNVITSAFGVESVFGK